MFNPLPDNLRGSHQPNVAFYTTELPKQHPDEQKRNYSELPIPPSLAEAEIPDSITQKSVQKSLHSINYKTCFSKRSERINRCISWSISRYLSRYNGGRFRQRCSH